MTEANTHERLVKALAEMSHDLYQAHAVLDSGGSLAAVVSTVRTVADRAASLARSLEPHSAAYDDFRYRVTAAIEGALPQSSGNDQIDHFRAAYIAGAVLSVRDEQLEQLQARVNEEYSQTDRWT